MPINGYKDFFKKWSIHTMEYYLAFKRNEILCDSASVRFLEESSSWRQEVDGGCRGLGDVDGEFGLHGARVSVGEDE